MASTPYAKFRLGADTLADLDALAASNGGNRSQALREAIAYWRMAVEEAGRRNAAELTAEEWTLLGHLNDPDPFSRLAEDDDPLPAPDWSRLLALELTGTWEGRPAVAPYHLAERDATRKLARKVNSWGPVRGYALMAALRYFWRSPEAGIMACAAPEVWLAPTARGE